MHEHRGLGVPVRLGADVYAGDHDVQLVAALGELDDPAQHGRDPVHVLGAAVHGDLGPGREREPLDRHTELLRQVEGGDDAHALRLGERAERLGGISQQRNAQHPFRVPRGVGAREPDHDAGRVGGRRAVDGFQAAALVEVVLLELAAEQLDDLGGMERAPAARRNHAQGSLVQRLNGRHGGRVDLDEHAAPGRLEEADQTLAPVVARLVDAAVEQDHLDAQTVGGGSVSLDHAPDLLAAQLDDRPGVEHHTVPQRPLARRQVGQVGAHGLERLRQNALQLGDGEQLSVGVVHRRHVPHLGEREQPLVLGILVGSAAEQIHVLRRGQSLELELLEAPEPEAIGHPRVQPAQRPVLDHPTVVGLEGEEVDRGHPAAALGLRHGDDHLPQHRRRADLLEPFGDRGRELVARRHGPGVLGVEVGDQFIARSQVGGERAQGAYGRGQVAQVAERDGEQARAVLEPLGEQEVDPVHLREVHVAQRVLAVVAAGHGLDEDVSQRGRGRADPPGQERSERLGAGDESAHPLVAIVAGGIVRQGGQVLLHLGVDPLAGLLDHRLVEVAVANGAGEVGHDGLAVLGRGHQAVEQLSQLLIAGVDLGDPLQPPFEDPEHGGLHCGHAKLGEEDPVARLLELGGPLQVVDGVAGERLAELVDECLRQPLRLRIQGAQVGVQVLLGRADQLGLDVSRVVPRMRQRTQVGEEAEQAVLLGHQPDVAAERRRADGAKEVGRDEGLVLGDVVAEDELLEPADARSAALAELVLVLVLVPVLGHGREVHPVGLRLSLLVAQSGDPEQWRLARYLRVGAGQHLGHAAVERARQRALHLHALDHGDHVARPHLVTDLDRDRHHHARPGGAHDAALLARDPVGHAVDLDPQLRTLPGRDGPVGAAREGQPALVGVEPLEADVEQALGRHHIEARRSGLGHPEAVVVIAVAELHRRAGLAAGLGPAAAGEGVEPRPVGLDLGLVELERRLDQRRVGVPHGLAVSADVAAIQPASVVVAGQHGRVVEQVEQEAVVRGPVVQHGERLSQRAPEPDERLRAVPAPGDQLRDHGVELRWDDVALGHARVHAQAGAGRQPQELDSAGGGGEVERRDPRRSGEPRPRVRCRPGAHPRAGLPRPLGSGA